MLDPQIIDAMVASGCTVEQLAAVVKAHLAAQHNELLVKRHKAAIIKRNQRSRACPPMSTGHRRTEKLSNKINGHVHRTSQDTQNLSIYNVEAMHVESMEVKEEESKKVRKKVRKNIYSDLPENWCPPDRSRQLASDLGLDVADMEARWRDYLASSGKQYANHDAAFCNFLRNEQKFNPSKNPLPAKPLTFHQATQLHNARIIHETLFGNRDQEAPKPVRAALGRPTLSVISEPSGNCFDP